VDRKKASPYVPFINIAPIVAGTNGISPIFLTTVDVTGGIGLDLQNWVKLLMKMEMQFVMKMVM
jgi:aconitate hydratase 2/2-methylisocitrate dehydratase